MVRKNTIKGARKSKRKMNINKRTKKRRPIKYGGDDCISAYVKDINDNDICCDDIAHYYEFKLQQQGGPDSSPSNLNPQLRKLTGDCLSKEFRDVRDTPVKLTDHLNRKYKKLDKYFETLENTSYLKSLLKK